MNKIITYSGPVKKEDYDTLAQSFLANFWEINFVSPKASWIDSSFWQELGFNGSEEVTHEDNGFSTVLKKDLDEFLLAIEPFAEDGTKKICKQVRFLSKSNEVVWMELSGVVFCEKGVKLRVFGTAKNVTEFKHKEQVLKEESLYFKNVIIAGKFATWQYNFKTELIRVNERYAEIIGYTIEELQTLTKDFWKTFVHDEDKDLLTNTIQNLLLNNKPFEIEYRLRHKSGNYIWVLVSGEGTKKDQENRLELISGCLFDITERKRNELLLLDYSNIMKRINKVAKIRKWEVAISNNELSKDLDTIMESGIRNFIGSSDDYVPSFDDLYEVIRDGKEKEEFLEKVTLATEKGVEYDVVLPIITQPNDVEKWARVIGIPEFKNNECVRLYGFFQDIDKETSITRELAVKEEQLRHNFNQAAVGKAFVNLDGRLDRVNKELLKIVGFSEKELLSFSFGHITHPEDLKIAQDIFKSVIMKKQDSAKGEFRCIHKRGHIIWVNVVISKVKTDAGELMHLFLQVQNVSENKRLTENLKEHNSRLINFAHIVSHNLRSHASNISMLLDLVFKDYPSIMENEFLKNIKTVSDNLNSTIYDLNEIVELNSNINTKLTAQKLSICLEKSMQNINSIIKEANAIITIDVEPTIEVLAINAYLESILLNLLTNAFKYRMPNRRLTINILAEVKWDTVIFSIRDNGLGIDLEKHKDKLFGLYKIFHKHKDAKGVGLFIVKNQIEAMGGRIEVTSKVNIGTEFKVFFKKG